MIRSSLLLLALCGLPAPPAAGAQEEAAARAREAWQRGERLRAVDLAAEALAARPEDRALRHALAEWQMATHRYEGALATAEGHDELASIAGRALYLLGRHEEALRHLAEDDPLDVVLRVDALEALGDDAATWAALERAEELALGAEAHLATVRGRLLAREGRAAEAAEAFRAALAADPLEPGAHFGLGRALVSLGRREEGLDVLARHRELVPLLDERDAALRALDLAPLHGPNHAQLGDVERALGRVEVARAAYERAGQLATPEQLVPIALRYARLLDEDLDDVDGAVTLLDATAGRVPDARLAVRAGDLLAAAGRWSEAVERYERADALHPGDPRIAERLSRAREQAAP